MRFPAAATLAALIVSSCGTTFQVEQAPYPLSAPSAPQRPCTDSASGAPTACPSNSPSRVPGIPFFAKKPRWRQETEFRRTALIVTPSLSYAGRDPAVKPAQIKLDKRAVANTPDNRQALTAIAGRAFSTADEGKAELEKLLAQLDKQAFDGEPEVSANRILVDMVLDTSRIYYLNSSVPLVGSATTSFELSSDQTLTKGSATVEDKTLSTILSALPLKELVAKGLGIQNVDAAPSDWVVELAVEAFVVEAYRVRKLLAVGQELPKPITWKEHEGAGFEWELVTQSGSDSKDAFKFSGTVTPPK